MQCGFHLLRLFVLYNCDEANPDSLRDVSLPAGSSGPPVQKSLSHPSEEPGQERPQGLAQAPEEPGYREHMNGRDPMEKGPRSRTTGERKERKETNGRYNIVIILTIGHLSNPSH